MIYKSNISTVVLFLAVRVVQETRNTPGMHSSQALLPRDVLQWGFSGKTHKHQHFCHCCFSAVYLLQILNPGGMEIEELLRRF